ncbi:hypothetical protein BG003_004554 [Podila horticola]|nr:hypothetical protein BG003_004554 [Podila horticola]
MTDNILTLFCLVDGEATSTAFSIKIPSNDTVDDLKKLIKVEKANDFSDIDANQLTLWRVSIPVVTANRNKPINLTEIDSITELDPTDDVSYVFTDQPPKKTIHIIVQRPPREEDWIDVFTEIETQFFASDSSQVTNLYQFVRGSAQPLVPKLAGIVRTAGLSQHCGQGACDD